MTDKIKERPILFQGAMVRAILDGRKTQTRRVVKVRMQQDSTWVGGWAILHKALTVGIGVFNDLRGKMLGDDPSPCPYGKPGDRLWVRETFMDLTGTGVEHRDRNGLRQRYAFAADSQAGSYGDEARKEFGLKWKPSIHMPRAASRILLEVVSVRVERMQDISESDALAEGISAVRTPEWDLAHFPEWRRGFDEACARREKPPIGPLPSQSYRALWGDINGAGSWDANPWVWVVEFKRVQP